MEIAKLKDQRNDLYKTRKEVLENGDREELRNLDYQIDSLELKLDHMEVSELGDKFEEEFNNLVVAYEELIEDNPQRKKLMIQKFKEICEGVLR
jgi:hypothetical protein